jgi:hypothetical protein
MGFLLMKKFEKTFVLVLFPLLLSSLAHAELKHPTCEITLANVNASIKDGRAIRELKKVKSFTGRTSRKKIIGIFEKAQAVDVNSMIQNALTQKGYMASFPSSKGGGGGGGYIGLYNHKIMDPNSDMISKEIGVEEDYYQEEMIDDMRASFGLAVQCEREHYIGKFLKKLTFTVELKINPRAPGDKMETFFKYTSEVKVKHGDVKAAFAEAVEKALKDAPNCQIMS